MLVLSRRLNEAILIAGNIEVTVVQIDRGRVKLGITAPREVEVWRTELLDEGGQPEERRP